MRSMLEKAARALDGTDVDWSSDGCNGILAETSLKEHVVRAVLGAIREPDAAMAQAGSAADALTEHYGTDDYRKEATKVWQAMIDAILAGEESKG